MILREYQATAVNRSLDCLKRLNNTLLVAATGSGKTICLSALISEFVNHSQRAVKVLVLQHRKEIIWQNMQKFNRVDPSIHISLINQESKDNSGTVVFAMIQTLHRNPDLIQHYDLIVIDEAHHVVAESYLQIIRKIRVINPEAKVFGVTATPLRGDGKRLADVFNNVSYAVDMEDLIASGVLVKPKAYVLDIGLSEEIEKRTNGKYNLSNLEFDTLSSEIIQNFSVELHTAFKYWQELAVDRKTVVFTPTNKDSMLISHVFNEYGIKTAVVTHDTPKRERERILNDFQHGDIQVLFNTSILTEGWDCPIASCIVLFKSSSNKSTYIQMVGRGLRSYPGKQDCVLIDFGVSTMRHGSLEQNFFKSVKAKDLIEIEETAYKICPGCKSKIPSAQKVCFICGFEFEGEEAKKKLIEEFKLKEIELIKNIEEKCSYKFVDVNENDKHFIAVVDFKSYIGIFKKNDYWYVVGNLDSGYTEMYSSSKSKAQCYEIAYKKLRSSSNKADIMKKNKEWLNYPPTDKQLALLKTKKIPQTRYEVTCHLAYQFNRKYINRLLN
jgi:superfamily II DNA or RNA helicase